MTGIRPGEPADPYRDAPIAPAEPTAPRAMDPAPPPGAFPDEPGRDLPPQHQLDRTRTGGLWVAVTAAAIVLLLLLIFILQNSEQVQVSFLALDGKLPLGVAMLLSAVAGALLVALLGTARIVQLRRVARKHRKEDAGVAR